MKNLIICDRFWAARFHSSQSKERTGLALNFPASLAGVQCSIVPNLCSAEASRL